MHFLWQYPAKAEPVSSEPETITVDKWFVQASEPVRHQPKLQYFHPGLFWSNFTPSEIQVTLDQWFSQAPMMVYRSKYGPGLMAAPSQEVSWIAPTLADRILNLTRKTFLYTKAFWRRITDRIILDRQSGKMLHKIKDEIYHED